MCQFDKKKNIKIMGANNWQSPFIGLSVLVLSVPAAALQPLNDTQLSGVSGRDGITVTLNTQELGMERLNLELNSPGAGETGYLSMQGVDFTPVDTAGALDTNPINFATTFDIGSDTNTGIPYLSLGLDLSRTRLMVDNLTVGNGEPTTTALAANTTSFGEFAIDASAKVDYVNRGLFSVNTSDAYLYGELNDFNLYYRQINDPDAPYFVGTGGSALWRVMDGSIGIKQHVAGTDRLAGASLLNGSFASVHTSADFIDLQFDYRLGFKAGDGNLRMTPENAMGLMRFGWTGTFYQPELDFSTQLLDGSSGLVLSTRFNYLRADGGTSADLTPLAAASIPSTSSAFRWIFGSAQEIPDGWGAPAGSNRYPTIMLSDWRNMYDNQGNPLTYGHDFPYIAIGVVNGDTHNGYGDLCWGGRASGLAGAGCGAKPAAALYDYETITGFAVNNPALGVSVRQGNLLTYAETIDVYDGSDITQPFNLADANNRRFDWGLMYTFANIDGDIYLYPGGHPDGSDRGITADILLMSQTLNNGLDGYQDVKDQWQRSSILMIADTDPSVSQGIGMMNISWLLRSEQTRILLKPLGTTGTDAEKNYAGGLDITSPNARFNLRATFGGRDLLQKGTNHYKDLDDPINGTNYLTDARVLIGGINDWNYEGFLNLRLSPPVNNEHYVGYSLAFRANPNQRTYFRTAEPAQPDVDLCFCNVTGDMAFVDGKLELASSYAPGQNGYPALKMSHTIKVGLTASGTDVTTYHGSGSPANNNAATNKMLDSAWGVGGATGLPGGALGQPFVINALEFNGNSVGAIAVPSGQIYGSLTLRPQTPSM